MAASMLLGTYDPSTARYRGAPQDKSEIAELAHGLRVLAESVDCFPAALPQVARGFRELGLMAHAHGEVRMRSIALAFASMLDNSHRAPEGDIPFILDTAIAYLQSLPG